MSEPTFTIPTQEELAELSSEVRQNMAAAYLAGVEPGRFNLELFTEMARLTVLSTVELTPLIDNPETGRIDVLLTQRPPTDPWWAYKWHLPGSVILGTDEVAHDKDIDFDDPDAVGVASYMGPLNRIIATELRDGLHIVDGPYLHNARFRRGIRGPESTVMLCAGVEIIGDEPKRGTLFDIASVTQTPPEGGLVVGHASSIRRAAATYAALRS